MMISMDPHARILLEASAWRGKCDSGLQPQHVSINREARRRSERFRSCGDAGAMGSRESEKISGPT